MNKIMVNVVIGAVLALVIAGGSSYVTYIVDDHFDYVSGLEDKVEQLETDKAKLEQENLGLLSVVNEPSK